MDKRGQQWSPEQSLIKKGQELNDPGRMRKTSIYPEHRFHLISDVKKYLPGYKAFFVAEEKCKGREAFNECHQSRLSNASIGGSRQRKLFSSSSFSSPIVHAALSWHPICKNILFPVTCTFFLRKRLTKKKITHRYHFLSLVHVSSGSNCYSMNISLNLFFLS